MRKLVVTGLIAMLVALGAGCGSSNKSSGNGAGGQPTATTQTVHFAKTKFVLHAGLAFGAFHRYIYKPFKQGKFSGGLLRHKLATAKAALAAVFAYHEAKLALNDARSSRVLSALLAPLLALQSKLGGLGQSLRHGSVDASAIQSTNSDASAISAQSASQGQAIHDQPTPQLGG